MKMEKIRKIKAEKTEHKETQELDNINHITPTFDEKIEHIIELSRANFASSRKKYDEDTKIFWIKEFLLGRKCFNYNKALLHGPSLSTIYVWLNRINCPHFEDFLNILNMPNMIKYYKSKYSFDSIHCSLSIDAMKIDEDISINQNGVVEGLIKKMTIKEPSIYYQNQKEFFIFYDKCKKQMDCIFCLYG